MQENKKDQRPPVALEAFQKTYSDYIRGSNTVLPKGIPPRRSEIYEHLLRNNNKGFLDRCFPVAKSILSENEWQELCTNFFKSWVCHTPYFSQIPKEFCEYIRRQPPVYAHYPWLPELIHYEWIELEVALAPCDVQLTHVDYSSQMILATNPSLKNLQYSWPVHKITKDQLVEAQPTFLAVYRTENNRVTFIELNALTSALIELLQTQPQTTTQCLNQLSTSSGIPNENIVKYGQTLINNFFNQNILYEASIPHV